MPVRELALAVILAVAGALVAAGAATFSRGAGLVVAGVWLAVLGLLFLLDVGDSDGER